MTATNTQVLTHDLVEQCRRQPPFLACKFSGSAGDHLALSTTLHQMVKLHLLPPKHAFILSTNHRPYAASPSWTRARMEPLRPRHATANPRDPVLQLVISILVDGLSFDRSPWPSFSFLSASLVSFFPPPPPRQQLSSPTGSIVHSPVGAIRYVATEVVRYPPAKHILTETDSIGTWKGDRPGLFWLSVCTSLSFRPSTVTRPKNRTRVSINPSIATGSRCTS